METKVTNVMMRAQGNLDKDSNRAKARYRWVTHLLLQLRLHCKDTNMMQFIKDFVVDGAIPKAFDLYVWLR